MPVCVILSAGPAESESIVTLPDRTGDSDEVGAEILSTVQSSVLSEDASLNLYVADASQIFASPRASRTTGLVLAVAPVESV